MALQKQFILLEKSKKVELKAWKSVGLPLKLTLPILIGSKKIGTICFDPTCLSNNTYDKNADI